MANIITFAQQKGGAGKTMLLTQVAAAMAGAGRAVALVDLDPQRSSCEWFEARTARLGDGGGISLIESANWRASSDIRKAAKEALSRALRASGRSNCRVATAPSRRRATGPGELMGSG